MELRSSWYELLSWSFRNVYKIRIFKFVGSHISCGYFCSESEFVVVFKRLWIVLYLILFLLCGSFYFGSARGETDSRLCAFTSVAQSRLRNFLVNLYNYIY